MRPFSPRLQGTKYRFTKYFDVAGAEMAAFVCFSSVFASFVKQHRLTIFFAASRDAILANPLRTTCIPTQSPLLFRRSSHSKATNLFMAFRARIARARHESRDVSYSSGCLGVASPILRAKCGHASTHFPHSMQSPAATRSALPERTSSRISGSHRHAAWHAPQCTHKSWSIFTLTKPKQPSVSYMPPRGHNARHHTRCAQNSSANTIATNVKTPANEPNSTALFTALMGFTNSNTGTLHTAERASTAAAIPTFALRGTARSRTAMPNLPRSQSTNSHSRFTGHAQPQKARPRTTP